MKRFLIYTGFILLLFFGSFGQAQAFTKIDTTPSWDGESFISMFGYDGATPTYGQVITVPATETVLQDFSFHILVPDTCTFRGFVYAWDGPNNRATGSALYESQTMTTLGSGGFEKIQFRTGGIAVTPGSQYVLFVSTSKDSGSGYGYWGTIRLPSPYSGGDFVYQNNTNTAEWTTVTWGKFSYDLAFTATFAKSTILYWKDGSLGTDHISSALTNIGDTYEAFATTATGLDDFESKVNSGGWDLIILAIQNAAHSTPNFNAYVTGGGKAILGDFSKDATRGALFGVTYTGNDNQDVVTISDDIFFKGVRNPTPLSNPGYGIFSIGMAATPYGVTQAIFPNKNAAIVVGASGKTIVNGFLTGTAASADDGVTLYENEVLGLLPFKLVTPNGGEKVPAGGFFDVTWIPGEAVSFSVDLSTNKGSSWKSVATQQAGTRFEWRVPLQKDNTPNCKIRVTGYDSYGVKVAQDVSDSVFQIQVVGMSAPNGGESWKSGTSHTVKWKTNETMGAVGSVQLFYALDGKKWKPITTVAGDPGTYLWTVPAVTASTATCKVKAALKSLPAGKGKTLGTAVSEASFTIYP